MKYEDLMREALEDMQHGVEVGSIIFQFPQDEKIIAAIMVALSKQISVKVDELDTDSGCFICGECGATIDYEDEHETHSYCLTCGQKIKWE